MLSSSASEGAAITENSNNSSVVVSDVEATKIDSITNLHLQSIVNLDKGDPTMYESYWKNNGEDFGFTIYGSQNLSYFANPNSFCWFLVPKLEEEIKILHSLVGNAIVEDHHIVVGNGSSQLIQAALYAMADSLNQCDPVNVVSSTPFYSCYPEIVDLVKSGLFKWDSDANKYEKNKAYIELVTSPNNPDGEIRRPRVNRDKGMVIHDLAYYWPQYTAIIAPADHDVMLFTISKCTGHAGSRIGWALVNDAEVAKKMVKFIEINTIGVSKEAQLRAACILEKIIVSCNGSELHRSLTNFFEHNKFILAERWKRLREALKKTQVLQVPGCPPKYCNFMKDFIQASPAYAWLKSVQGADLAKVLHEKKIRVRGGQSFGVGVEYARVSMLGKGEDFDIFIGRLQQLLAL